MEHKVDSRGCIEEDSTHDASDVLISTRAHGEMLFCPSGLSTECNENEEISGYGCEVSASEEHSFTHKELSQDGISTNLDIECGEPITSQHLRIDFKPLEGVDDTEFLLNKCTEFWKLIEGSRKLQEMMVLPEKVIEVTSIRSSQSTESDQSELQAPSLDAIDIMARKGRMVDDCFMNKMRTRHCEEGSGDYFVDLPYSKIGAVTRWASPGRSTRPRQPARQSELTQLCAELEKWDLNHPKSFEPPNHGHHTYAMMQRN